MIGLETLVSSIIIGIVVFFAVYFAGKHTDETLINKLRVAGAETPETAVKSEMIGITDSWHKLVLKKLVKEGKLAVTEDGRYYVVKQK